MPSQDLVVKLKAENSELKARVKESERALKDFTKAAKDAAKQSNDSGWSKMLGNLTGIKTGAGGANGALGLLTGGLGKLAAGFGVAMGAGALFNQMLASSNSLGDEVNRVQTQAASAVSYFASSLANCDFSNFLTGLSNAWTQAGNLADQLDRVNTALQALGVRNAKRNLQIAEIDAELAKLPTGDKRRNELNEQKEALQKQGISETQDVARQMRESAITRIKTAAGISETDTRFDKAIEDLIENKNSKMDQAAADAWKKAKGANNAAFAYSVSSGTMTGNTGMFNTQAVTKFRAEASKAEKEIEKLGYTADQAHIMSRLFDVNDNAEDSPLTQARRSMEQSYNMQAQAQQQLNATVRKHTKDLTKQANAAAKVAGATQKVYTENARTEQQLKDNLSILEEQKAKLDPQSDKWTEIRDKIEKTKEHLESIKLTGLPVDSLAAMRNELQKVNQQMETLSTNTKEFADAAAKANSLNAKISDATAEPGTRSSDKSLAGYQKKIQELNAELSKFTEPFSADDVRRIEQINQEIKACEESVQRLRKAFEQPPVAGSIDEAAKSMQEYDQKIQNAATDAERAALGVERMKAANLLADKSAAAAGVDTKMINREKRSDNNTDLQKKTETASYAQEQAARIQQQVELGVMGADEAKSELKEINGVLKEIGAEPIEIDVKSNKLKKTLRDVNYAAEAVGSLGQAASTLGQAFESPELNVAGIIAQSIANIALSTSEAIVQSTAMGPWGWVAFSAAAIAEMAAMIAQIHSVTGYASGGIVEGSSYSGDKISARLNSGEMVLNRRQQGHLFDALDSGRIGGGGVTEVEWRLRGSDLYGSVKNYSKTTARAGRRTGIR